VGKVALSGVLCYLLSMAGLSNGDLDEVRALAAEDQALAALLDMGLHGGEQAWAFFGDLITSSPDSLRAQSRDALVVLQGLARMGLVGLSFRCERAMLFERHFGDGGPGEG
jgi:hypothetical protein